MAYTVSVLCQFMHDSRERHMQTVEISFLVLKVKLRKWALFKKGDSLILKIYTNTDYVNFVTNKKSTFVLYIGRKYGALEKQKNRVGYLVEVHKLNFMLLLKVFVKEFG